MGLDSEAWMEQKSKGLPTYLILFLLSLLVMILLSAQFLYTGIRGYLDRSPDAYYNITFGVISLISTAYISMQFRRRAMWASRQAVDVMSTVECLKCGFKSIRKFIKGDYVLKPAEGCPQCHEPMAVTSIYPEEKGKKPS